MDVRFPIGALELPDKITLRHIDEWLNEIEHYIEDLRATVIDLDEDALQKKYREGSWNVRELVHHIADSQLNMYQRLKLALTDDNPKVVPFNQDEWIQTKDNDLPVQISVQLLDGLNKRIVAVGRTLKEQQINRTFSLIGEGPISVGETIAKLSWHQSHHLAHIKIALS
ncbi:YfiT family bacillithiol transferase [Staphylococcus gallinarum]|uniref:YfiT family bacillithiol transferase n=1 Tax=Staphylococcus gallinarum TaxID=1293 RepID=UPI001E3419DD|nr:putative metal-dependent hydrolase [Staphylococcus gallinarum]MCD8921466.1 putative metal-dependent hydrolase [Staphylococcus gallinarum]MEB6277935.1 putative metal-dependent hydrolase [Staphylococcus gallinarum]MEB7038596.1 putative metal-dependent hydrolase [Staphylococcus gallinarum]UEH00081.1 putative metal-dependent hydrolase [Staphylococcus gallinarum]